MNLSRRIILSFCLIFVAILSIAWLVLLFAAPNPTHRWYSTDVLDVRPSVTSEQKGIQAEDLLALDLGLNAPTNERSGNAMCVCGIEYENTGTTPPKCSQCIFYSNEISTYRIPDFVTTSYIAESKNHRDLIVSHTRDFQQSTDIAVAARALGIPFYIFVRVNTFVDQEYYDLTRSTGGDVIRYFLVDPNDTRLVLEQAIPNLILILLVVAAGVLIVGYISNNRPKRPADSIDEVDKAEDSVEETEEFMKRMERLSKRSKDDDEKKGKS